MKPRCPYYGSCGGCQLQHLPYEEQLEKKTKLVKEALKEVGLDQVKVWPTHGMDNPWFYRNKIQFPIRQQNNQLQMGYFKQRTHEVVNIKECYIQDPFLTEIAQISRKIFEDREIEAYNEKTGQGILRHFVGRRAFQTDEILIGIVVNGKGLPAGYTVAHEIKKHERLMLRNVARHADYPKFKEKPRIVGISQNFNSHRSNVILGEKSTNLLGITHMYEKLGPLKFKIQLPSFFQVNPRQTVWLYDLIRKYAELSGTEVVVDAFSGIGAIALWLAGKAAEVIAIEERPEAVRDARENAKMNELDNVTILEGQLEKHFPKKADVVVLDPPRGGCSGKALRLVVKAKPKKIIYVSCNPQSMAQDLRDLSDEGYQVEAVNPVDMFPQTEHVETVVKLSRNLSGG